MVRAVADLAREAALARQELAAYREHMVSAPPENDQQRRIRTGRLRELVDAVEAAQARLDGTETGYRLMSPEQYAIERRYRP